MACSRGFAAARIYCLPSPCARLSRARTTTETLPLDRVVAGLGSLPDIVSGARFEVPVFKGVTLDVLGVRLYPWLRRPPPSLGLGDGVPMTDTPSEQNTSSPSSGSVSRSSRVQCSIQRLPAPTSTCVGNHPTRFHHDISGSPSLRLWRIADISDRLLIPAAAPIFGNVGDPLLRPAQPGRG